MITRLIIFILVLWIIHKLVKQARMLFFQIKKREANELIMGGEMVQDPSCRVYIPKNTAIRQKIGQHQYYFCSQECARKFYESLKA